MAPYEYATRVLSIDREPVDYLTHKLSVTTTRQLNQATEITVTAARNRDPGLRAGSYVQRVRIRSDGSEEIVATARLGGRDVRADRVQYPARLDAALLENNITPANYGGALSDILLEDLARTLVNGWRVHRADWEQFLERSNADTTTEPGRVMIVKQTNGRYYASGFIVVRFDRQNTAEWIAWDRIRWESDFYDNVRTTMQWRHGEDAGAMSTWSSPVQGADPSGTGVSIEGTPSRFIDIRINLATDDTTTPQDVPEGQPVTAWGFTPRVFGLELIARTQGQITIGSIDVENHVFARDVTADRTNALQILQEACEANGHEFVVIDGELSVARELGRDRTNDFVLRNGENTSITTLRDDDQELVNKLHAYGQGTGLQQRYVYREDPESIALYGPYEDTAEFEESHINGLIAAADDYLAKHSHPQPQFEISGPDVHSLSLGDRVRIADPDTNTVVTTRVTELTEIEDGKGKTIRAHLGAPPRGLVDLILSQTGDSGRPQELLPPLVQVRATAPGFAVEVGHAPGSRSVSFRVHYSTAKDFLPSQGTQRGEGTQTLFTFPRAEPGRVHFVRVASVDRHGNLSSYSDQLVIRAGHVQTAQIGPGAVTNDQLGSGAVTNPKLDSGALGTSTRTQASGVSVMRGSTEVMKLGNITGKQGVPANVNEGLWGALGTGIFIQGVPRLVNAGSEQILVQSGDVIAGSTSFAAAEVTILPPFTVPVGRKYALLTSVVFASSIDYQNFTLQGFGVGSLGGWPLPPAAISFNAGSHSALKLQAGAVVRNTSSSTRATGVLVRFTWLLLDTDA